MSSQSVSAQQKPIKIKANEVHLLSSFANGTSKSFVVTKAVIRDIPSWSGEGKPPLSQASASQIAMARHKKQYGTAKLRSIDLKSKTVHYLRNEQGPDELWYYKVKVKGGQSKTYIVLMDGQFVEPR